MSKDKKKGMAKRMPAPLTTAVVNYKKGKNDMAGDISKKVIKRVPAPNYRMAS